LFTTLVLLGAIAVLVTGALGYFRARDALEKTVFDQLTVARQTKTRQVETYFRTIQAELGLLATSKMVVDATREFRAAVDQLDQAGAPPQLRQKVGDWYAENFIPGMTRTLGRQSALSDYLPVG
ncbi:adenylate/guanylate cyclase domain-containing protein, partial [Mesorhizobium sp. M1C.F.Ca.ET.196.01.1.1]